MIQMSIQNGNLSGFQVCRGGPLISHLFFADDSLVFLKASVQESQSLKHILAMYAAESRQQINFNKSSITFTANTPRQVRSQICSLLQVTEKDTLGTYLGLPSHMG